MTQQQTQPAPRTPKQPKEQPAQKKPPRPVEDTPQRDLYENMPFTD
jgi:hypothetical protein